MQASLAATIIAANRGPWWAKWHRLPLSPLPLKPGNPTSSIYLESLSWMVRAFEIVSLGERVSEKGTNGGAFPKGGHGWKTTRRE